MIRFLRGEVLDSSETTVTLGVGDVQSLVGYEIAVASLRVEKGEQREFHIYTHVREEAFDLYGFLLAEEREVFLTLIKCSGIGPKAAMGILSHGKIEELTRAILEGDKKYLNSLPGVGKKTADRMVVELKDHFKKKFEAGVLGDKVAGKSPHLEFRKSLDTPEFEEARLALVHLGYRDNQISAAFGKMELRPDEVNRARVEDLVKGALQCMG